MVGELIMLPVRVGVRATRLWFRAVEETFSVTTSAAGRVIGAFGSRGADRAAVVASRPGEPEAPLRPAPAPAAKSARPAETPPTPEPPPAAAPPIPEPPPAAAPPIPEPPPAAAPPIPEPVHVSEQPALADEFAEPGAEEGAGAEVHVDPPWDGYERMNANEIIARLAGMDAAELAAVELYEVTNRRRQTILNAVERELRRVNGSGSRGNQIQRG